MADSQPQTHSDALASSSLRATGDTSLQPYHWKVIVSTSIANALEWFDFVVYGFFAVVMAKLFFPSSNEVASLLAILRRSPFRSRSGRSAPSCSAPMPTGTAASRRFC